MDGFRWLHCTISTLLPPHVLGSLLGCYGTHHILRYIKQSLGGFLLLRYHESRPVISRLDANAPFIETKEAHEETELRSREAEGAPNAALFASV